MNVPLRHRPWNTMSQKERLERLFPLRAAGKSLSEIAEIFGTTRNAVSGAFNRAKEAGLKAPEKSARKHPRRKKASPRANMARIEALSAPEPVVPAAPVVPAIIERPDPLMLSLMQLTERTCRFSYGDPKAESFGFCGHETEPTSSWCPYHERIVWGGTL